MIRFLKKGGKHVWEELDDYSLITLENIDHQFLVTVLETAKFKPGFHKWISIRYPGQWRK